jgi:hypothetical protein
VWLVFLKCVNPQQCWLPIRPNNCMMSRFNIVGEKEWFLVMKHEHEDSNT